MKYAFLATFIIASVIHLYASLKCDKKLPAACPLGLVPLQR